MRKRGNWIAMIVLFCFVPVGTVRGDLGPPTVVTFPTMRFDNLADYPDFDFFLKYCYGPGNPYGSPYLTPIRAGEVFRLKGGPGRRTEVFLLAVPRGQQPPVGKDGPDSLWETPAGCLQSAPLDGTYAERGWLVPYRVHIENGKLEAAMQPGEWLAGEWSSSWLQRLPYILVPVALCAALGWLGVRLARRLFPPKQAPSAGGQ
jgi:hypothetical protein